MHYKRKNPEKLEGRFTPLCLASSQQSPTVEEQPSPGSTLLALGVHVGANGRELCTGQDWDPWVRGRENLNAKANLSHSPTQSRLFLISSVRAGASSLAASQLTAGGCRCCRCRPLC